MKKILLSVSGIALSAFLYGCDSTDTSQPQVIGNMYKTVQECSSDYSQATCEDAYKNALSDTIQNSPRYNEITECTNAYGDDGCAVITDPTVSTQDQHPGDVFIPKFQGFSVLVNYEPELDDDGDETGDYYPVYNSTGFVYQPFFFYNGYHPYVVSGGAGYTRSTTSIYTTRIGNRNVATTGVKVRNTFTKPSMYSVKTSITRSGFGTTSFSPSKSFSISRGGFGGRAGGFGGGRGG